MPFFTRGRKDLREAFNRDKEQLEGVTNFNLRGDQFITVQNVGGRAHVISLNLLALLRRIPHRGGGGGGPRLAFSTGVPGSGTTLAVYLDTDNEGSTVNVTCSIYDDNGAGATFADDTAPNPVDGCPLWVQQDVTGTWRNVTPIFKVEPCD